MWKKILKNFLNILAQAPEFLWLGLNSLGRFETMLN